MTYGRSSSLYKATFPARFEHTNLFPSLHWSFQHRPSAQFHPSPPDFHQSHRRKPPEQKQGGGEDPDHLWSRRWYQLNRLSFLNLLNHSPIPAGPPVSRRPPTYAAVRVSAPSVLFVDRDDRQPSICPLILRLSSPYRFGVLNATDGWDPPVRPPASPRSPTGPAHLVSPGLFTFPASAHIFKNALFFLVEI
jgi:hypothetical protein